MAVPLARTPSSVMEGGNVVVVLDVNEYSKGVEENRYSVLDRLTVQRGATQITTLDLKEKMSTV